MKAFFVFLALVAAYAFRLWQFPHADAVLEDLEKSVPQSLVVRIVDEPNASMYGSRTRAKVIATCDGEGRTCTDIDPDTFVQISYSKQKAGENEVEIGDIVTLTGVIKQMTFSSDQQSLQNFFKKEKVFYEIKSAKITHVKKPRSLKRQLVRFRKAIEASIASALPRPHSDLGQGLIVSGKGSMSKDLLEKFKRVGLIHIVVLSGSNVSIIAAALMSAFRFLPRFICGVVSLTCMSFFALMTGAAPPVVRSVLMSSIPLTVPLWIDAVQTPARSGDPDSQNHKSDPVRMQLTGIRLLLLTGYVMCLYNPMFPVYDISFQLSFMATLGLVLYTEPISNFVGHRMPWITTRFGLREIVSSSLGTQVLVMPLLLKIGGSMSTVFLIANILVLPILPITMFCLFVTSLSSFIMPVLAGVTAFVSWIFLEWILKVADVFSGIPIALVHIIDLDTRGVLLYYTIVLSITAFVMRRSKSPKTNNAPT